MTKFIKTKLVSADQKVGLAGKYFDVGYLHFSQAKVRLNSDSKNTSRRKSEMRNDVRFKVRKNWKSG